MISGPEKLHRLISVLSRAILGKEDIIKRLVVGLSANGHILCEDVPGVGKTTLVKALAKAVGCVFRRIQCTPDLLPTDITGVSIYNHKTGSWAFQKGPVFTQILLADEINRTSPKTQSSLLEAMEEKQVTVDGTTHALDEPFFVIATQNPHEYEGTFPLPESQLDRFTMKLSLGYPPKDDEIGILTKLIHRKPLDYIEQVMEPADLVTIQNEIMQIHAARNLLEYATELSTATREHREIELGVSPRGTLHLVKSAKAWAYLCRRDYVLPDDIQEVFFPVFGHRIILKHSAFLEEISSEDILREVLSRVRVPGNNGRR